MIKRLLIVISIAIATTILPYYIGQLLVKSADLQVNTNLKYLPIWFVGILSLVIIVFILCIIYTLIDKAIDYIKNG